MILAVEVISNRHWYEVLASYATLDANTAYYRIELIEEAFGGGMNGHWLLGYGGDIGVTKDLAGWEHKDITNHYILVLVRYGLLGILPLMAAAGAALRRVRLAYTLAWRESDRWLIWCIMSSLAGILISLFSVSLFGQPVTIFYILLAVAATCPEIQEAPPRHPMARRRHPSTRRRRP